MKVHISTLGLLAVFYGLYLWAQATSFAEVLAIYVGPYLVVNAWLTLITLLHHTHAEVPHYDDRAWTWLRGKNHFNILKALLEPSTETTPLSLMLFIIKLEPLMFSTTFSQIFLTTTVKRLMSTSNRLWDNITTVTTRIF